MALNNMLAAAALNGAAIGPNLGAMCGSCAFKLSSDANLEDHTCEDAAHCLLHGLEFYCHRRNAKGELECAGKPCVGFLYAERHFTSLDNANGS